MAVKWEIVLPACTAMPKRRRRVFLRAHILVFVETRRMISQCCCLRDTDGGRCRGTIIMHALCNSLQIRDVATNTVDDLDGRFTLHYGHAKICSSSEPEFCPGMFMITY